MKVSRCDTFWGSHGCKLDEGHEGHHTCSVTDYDEDGTIIGVEYCSQHDGVGFVRYNGSKDPKVGGDVEWSTGWLASAPTFSLRSE